VALNVPRGQKGEGRREKGEGRREKGEGRREKGEGTRDEGEGRGEKGEIALSGVWTPLRLRIAAKIACGVNLKRQRQRRSPNSCKKETVD